MVHFPLQSSFFTIHCVTRHNLKLVNANELFKEIRGGRKFSDEDLKFEFLIKE